MLLEIHHFEDSLIYLALSFHGLLHYCVTMENAYLKSSNILIILHECCLGHCHSLDEHCSMSALFRDSSRRYHPFPDPFPHPFDIQFWDASELRTDFQCLVNLKDIALLKLGTLHLFEEVQQLHRRVDLQ